MRRSQRKAPPEGFRGWVFECRVGAGESSAEPRTLKEIGGSIDAVAQTGATAVYVEIIARPARPIPASGGEAG